MVALVINLLLFILKAIYTISIIGVLMAISAYSYGVYAVFKDHYPDVRIPHNKTLKIVDWALFAVLSLLPVLNSFFLYVLIVEHNKIFNEAMRKIKERAGIVSET